jgi:NADH-quinone oxidoreductase subunit C
MDRNIFEQSIISVLPAVRLRAGSDRAAIETEPGQLIAVMRRLREDKAFSFDLLLDHTAVDYADQNRFELVYTLYSLEHGHHLQVWLSVDRQKPVVPSISRIWPGAHWQEREVFDLFGILYEGHDDLRRLFLEDNWQGYPLRKDYKDDHMLEFP